MKNLPTTKFLCNFCEGFGYAWQTEADDIPYKVDKCLVCHGKGFR